MIARPKHQRLVLVGVAIVALGAAALLALWGLSDRAAFFVTPSEVAEGELEPGASLRLGGMVEDGSIERASDSNDVAFRLTDGGASVAVQFTGITPDLFREGSGAVAEGQLRPDGVFAATRILAKHDENYMPPPMEGSMADGSTTGDDAT